MQVTSNLLTLKPDSTVITGWHDFDICCIAKVADFFVSQAGEKMRCGICENQLKGIILRQLTTKKSSGNLSSIVPSLGSLSLDLKPRGIFFTKKQFRPDKISLLAKRHGFSYDNLQLTDHGYYLTFAPDEWFEHEPVVLRKIAQGAVAVYGLPKEEYTTKCIPAGPETVKEDYAWWRKDDPEAE